MGININNAVSWSYSGFTAFRSELAAYEGFVLSAMKDCGGDRPWNGVDTVLEPLLRHTDDNGFLTPRQCGQMHERLLTAVNELWPPWEHFPDGERGRALADAMKDAAERGYSLNYF